MKFKRLIIASLMTMATAMATLVDSLSHHLAHSVGLNPLSICISTTNAMNNMAVTNNLVFFLIVVLMFQILYFLSFHFS